MENKIKQIALHYGTEKQVIKTVEELGELIVALQKLQQNLSSANLQSVIEEIADVEIMTAQLKYLYSCDTDIWAVKAAKLNRQLERIRGEGNG